jgi:hypothetical protein
MDKKIKKIGTFLLTFNHLERLVGPDGLYGHQGSIRLLFSSALEDIFKLPVP